ncbi:hypothetical protein Dimus_033022 [Dionaea muscipula]
MEGVGARLGRSSSRYGTTTVFSGPVRKWKKKWVHVTPSSNAGAAAANPNHRHLHSLADGSINGDNGSSHLLLFKWTPISQRDNDSNSSEEDRNSAKDDAVSGSEEPNRRKFKYIPSSVIFMEIRTEIAVLEEQRKETEENTDDDDKPTDNDGLPEPTSNNGNLFEKPDINDMPMEGSQDPEQKKTVSARQDLNARTLDLSLGLSSHEEDLAQV